ncbi:unnamed protein product [Arctogadus glacialis]
MSVSAVPAPHSSADYWDLAVFSLSIRNIPWTVPSALQLCTSFGKTPHPSTSCVQGRRESFGEIFDELVALSGLQKAEDLIGVFAMASLHQPKTTLVSVAVRAAL